MILRPFRILTFVEKVIIPPFFILCVYCISARLGSTWLNPAQFLRFPQVPFHIFYKDATLLLGHPPPGYPPPSYPPPGYLPSYLMLPNLTNHFIKLSDGDLQCE